MRNAKTRRKEHIVDVRKTELRYLRREANNPDSPDFDSDLALRKYFGMSEDVPLAVKPTGQKAVDTARVRAARTGVYAHELEPTDDKQSDPGDPINAGYPMSGGSYADNHPDYAWLKDITARPEQEASDDIGEVSLLEDLGIDDTDKWTL
jgi:hypothetical protein